MAAQGPSVVPLSEPPDVTMEEAAAAAEPAESENRSTGAVAPEERSDSEESLELDDWEWLQHYDVFSEANYVPAQASTQHPHRRQVLWASWSLMSAPG